MDFVHPYQRTQAQAALKKDGANGFSLLDFWSHNTGIPFRRKSSKRHRSDRPSAPVALTPSLDTSTGIISVRYSGSDDATSTTASTPTTPHSSGSSERSFFFDASPVLEQVPEELAVRPLLPKRSASRRSAVRPASTAIVEQERPVMPLADQATTADRPPIPAKSPYRSSRTMVRLQSEMAEMSEEQSQDSIDETR
jgi:hypothetical protein